MVNKDIIIYALCVQADCCLCLSVYFTLIAHVNTFTVSEMSRQNNMQMLDSLDKFNVYSSVCTNLDGLIAVDKFEYGLPLAFTCHFHFFNFSKWQ